MERGLYMQKWQALHVLLWLCWIMDDWPAWHRLCQILCDICTAMRPKVHGYHLYDGSASVCRSPEAPAILIVESM